MKENKLGTYLASFDNKDWSAYHKFSKSLYSEDSDCQRTIDYIKKHKSQYDPNYMDSEYLRKKIRPSANKKVFSTVITILCKHIEKYLIWAEVENDLMMKDTLLLQALGKRGLTEQFHKHKEKNETRREAQPLGLWNGYHEFMAEYLLYYCNMTSDIKVSKEALSQAFNKSIMFNNTIIHYFVLEMQNRSVLLKESWITKIKESDNIFSSSHKLKPTINQLIKMKVHKDGDSFNFLDKEVKNKNLSQEIRHTILIHLLSFAAYKRNIGDESFKVKMSELEMYGIKSNLLFPTSKIPSKRFFNIIHNACDSQNFIWAESFIREYSKLVPETSIKSIHALGFAQIESSKCNFERVLQILSNTRYKHFEEEMRAKWLILCANYELNKENYESIEYNINNFKYFIKKNKRNTTELVYTSLLNTAKYLLNIARGVKLDLVIDKLSDERNIFFRNWLKSKTLEKINTSK